MNRLRHTDELVGFLVLLALVVMVGAILQAGLFGRWFQPTTSLRIILPASGVGGLVSGADIEVLGTRAGTVRGIVINPQRIYAEAEIDDQFRAVITRDSVGVVRRRFGVAGAAFVEIKRGSGAAMDWQFRGHRGDDRARPDRQCQRFDRRDPREDFSDHDRPRPRRSFAGRNIGSRRARRRQYRPCCRRRHLGARPRGGGFYRQPRCPKGRGILAQLESTGADIGAVVRQIRDGKPGLPALLRETGQILADVRNMTRDFKGVTARAPAIARNVDQSTENFPALLQQTTVTAQQLDKLLGQLRGHWLLGGGSAPEAVRLPATQARP